MSALAGGHLGTDFANGALPALLPFLTDSFSLSYTFAAGLMLASAASSSLVQPLFGLWSDRHGASWLLPAGVAIAGVGIGLAAAAPSYWLVVLFVVISGLGVAAYHPEGSKFAAYASGRKRASGMSAFAIGGNIGFALGPIVATPLVLWLGLRGGLLLALPPLAIAATLFALLPFLRTFVPDRSVVRRAAGEDRPGALTILLAVIGFRSLAWWGLLTFVPLWEVSLGHSKSYGNHLLALMLLVGGLGTIVVGPLADRIGRRPVLVASLAAAAPLILVFVVVGGAVGAIALALTGITVVGTFGLTMVMAQEYLPQHIGLASGLSIGFSIGLGGVAALGLGALADAVDLQAALYVSAAAPLAALALTLLLPSTRTRRQFEPEIAVPWVGRQSFQVVPAREKQARQGRRELR
jgi:FSR family fosmidomycin resistance protein-like MFS transporter